MATALHPDVMLIDVSPRKPKAWSSPAACLLWRSLPQSYTCP
jgi:hypothetical protein